MIILRFKEVFFIALLIIGISITGCGGGGNSNGGGIDITPGDDATNNPNITVPYIGGVPYETQNQINSTAFCDKFCSPSFLKFAPAACATYCPSHNNSAGLSYLRSYFLNSSDRLSAHPLSNTIGIGGGYGAMMTACTLGGCQSGWYCTDVDGTIQCAPD